MLLVMLLGRLLMDVLVVVNVLVIITVVVVVIVIIIVLMFVVVDGLWPEMLLLLLVVVVHSLFLIGHLNDQTLMLDNLLQDRVLLAERNDTLFGLGKLLHACLQRLLFLLPLAAQVID